MTAPIPAPLLAHYRSGATTVTYGVKVTLKSGAVLAFTGHDQDRVINGITYARRGGVMLSNAQSQTRLAVDNMEARGWFDAVVTAAGMAAGEWDFAAVEVILFNWADVSMGVHIIGGGRLGEITLDRSAYIAELRGKANAYAQSIGELYQPGCRTYLGSPRCGVNIAPFTVTGTLASVSDDGLVLFDPARTEPGPAGGKAITGITQGTLPVVTCVGHGLVAGQVTGLSGIVGMTPLNGLFYRAKTVPDADHFTLADTDTTSLPAYVSGGVATPVGAAGYFDYGVIAMTSGQSNGLEMEVKAYAPGTITLQLQLPRGVAAGDTYSMRAGCAGRFHEDCIQRFGNGANFDGEPHLPGADDVMQFGGA